MKPSQPQSIIVTIFLATIFALTSGVTDAAEKKTKTVAVKSHKTVAKRSHRPVAKPHTVEPVAEVTPVEPAPVEAPVRTVTSTNIVYGDTRVPTRSQHSQRDIDCLAKNIYYEAGSEPRAGKIAVAQVTLNRVRSGKFADTICGVVYQKSQFSWVREARRRLNLNDNRYQESLDVALAVLNGDELLESMTHALYFHNTSVRPAWGKPKVGKIGNHIFYRDRTPIVNDDI